MKGLQVYVQVVHSISLVRLLVVPDLDHTLDHQSATG